MIPEQQEEVIIGGWYSSSIPRIKTTDYTVTSSNRTIFADATNNTVDISLPVNPSQGMVVNIKCIGDTFTCRILRNGNNIDGAANDLTLALNVSRTLQYDSTYGWGILC